MSKERTSTNNNIKELDWLVKGLMKIVKTENSGIL